MVGRIILDANLPPGRVFFGWDTERPHFPTWTITVHPDTLHEQLSELPAWIRDAQAQARKAA